MTHHLPFITPKTERSLVVGLLTLLPRQSGLEEGAILTSVVLPPVYGALGHAGISAPDEAGL